MLENYTDIKVPYTRTTIEHKHFEKIESKNLMGYLGISNKIYRKTEPYYQLMMKLITKMYPKV